LLFFGAVLVVGLFDPGMWQCGARSKHLAFQTDLDESLEQPFDTGRHSEAHIFLMSADAGIASLKRYSPRHKMISTTDREPR
jgi:hypothetical protein